MADLAIQFSTWVSMAKDGIGHIHNPQRTLREHLNRLIKRKDIIMHWLIFKYLTTAAIVVLISEVAKRIDKVGSLIAALPTITVLTLIWLYIENQPESKIASQAYYTFWYVLPTLPMFLVFPAILPRIGFWPSLGLSALLTIACFTTLALVVKRWGIGLF